MANIAYIRVGFNENVEILKDDFAEICIDKYFIDEFDTKSAKNRPELDNMMNYVREGDIVYVLTISKFANSLADLLYLMMQLKRKNVQFRSLKEKVLDTTLPSGDTVNVLLETLSDFNKDLYKLHQAEGIAIAKANGKYNGRARRQINPHEFESLYNRWLNGEIKKKYICKKLNISIATLDRRIKELKKEN